LTLKRVSGILTGMNLYYIRAAVEAATGIKLTIEELKIYLIIEGLATYPQVSSRTFKGYDQYFGHVAVKEKK
jgi:hypothetical protein